MRFVCGEFIHSELRESIASFTEQFEERVGEEGVGDFQGIPASEAQPVRLLQLPRDSLLFGQVGQWDGDVLNDFDMRFFWVPSGASWARRFREKRKYQ